MSPLSIVVVSDNHYVVMIAALIKSIELNLSRDKKIDLYIIEDRISVHNKKKLQLSINPDVTTLIWKKISEIIPNGIKLPVDKSSYPLSIYARLFIPHFLSDNVDKVLYLDVDMIVLQDISLLFDTDLSHNIAAAVTDLGVPVFNNSWGGVKNYKELGFAPDTKYFNSGLLLMNSKLWKENKIAEQTIECINQNRAFANYPDQYGLNIVLANQWTELDSRWNHFATISHPAPYLIHFVQRKPIYKSYNSDRHFWNLFYFFLKQTAWKSFKPTGEATRYIKKIRNILEKIFQ